MVTRTIELTEEQNRRLEEVAADQGRPVSKILRERLEDLLIPVASPQAVLRQRAAALSGRFRSGLSDLSVGHDCYLEESLRE